MDVETGVWGGGWGGDGKGMGWVRVVLLESVGKRVGERMEERRGREWGNNVRGWSE